MARTVTLRQAGVSDWRTVPDAIIRKLLDAERRRWEGTLDWDLGGAWPELDRGRQLGTVSGLVTFGADGRPTGWTYYLVHNHALQIGAFVAESERDTASLVDGIFSDPASAAAERVTFFAFTNAPGLVAALRAHSLTVDRYWYLRRNIAGSERAHRSDVRHWRRDHLAATVALLQRAFQPDDLSRPFAPDGTEADIKKVP